MSTKVARFASLNSTCVALMDAERCLETLEDVMLGSVESLIAMSSVVVDVIPKVRRDCAICEDACLSF